MNFYCPTSDCAIHTKGKAFPTMMDCPMCDAPLEAKTSFTAEEEEILHKYPYVIAYPYERMLIEEDGRNKLELLAYTFLNGLKLWGLVLASEYFWSPLKSAKINELFRNNLYQPSFGNWNSFLRESISVLEKENVQVLFPEFIEAYREIEIGKNARKYKTETPFTNEDGQTAWKKTELTAIGTLINFRNRYLGHGLPLSKSEYAELYKEIYPILCDFLHALHFTADMQMLRCDGAETYSLQGKKITKSFDSRIVSAGGEIVFIDNQGLQLNLLPFYILPKQFLAGADQRAEIMVYEQNTGSRVVFFSPESIKAEESGQVLERIQLLIQEKEKIAPCAPEIFTPAYIHQWTQEHNEKTFTGLKREKKILEGIYQNRLEAENVLSTWFEAASSLLAVSAEAGSGKTNLLVHMQARYEQLGFTSLFIRAARCQSEQWEEVLRSVWNVPESIDLKEFIATHYSAKFPLMILVDGGNEHAAPSAFLHSLFLFLITLPLGTMKVVVSWRGASVSEMPLIPAEMEQHVFPAAERVENGILSKYALRLTGMNKIELEGAWEKYAADKNLRCRPNFEFSDLLIADASLVEELSNPLLLRLFMELFHGKGMPKAAKGFINLWAVWWNKIKEQPEEAAYLKNLSQALLEREQLQLSLDELFDHPLLGIAVKNIQIDSPHQQLLRKGIISQYFIDDSLQVSFTMEAALYYIAALDVNTEKLPSLPFEKFMWKEVARSFAWQCVASGQSMALYDWIDNESIPVEILVKGLSESLILNGARSTLQQLLVTPTARDYGILDKAFDLLAENRPGEKEQRATELLSELLLHPDPQGRELKIRLMSDAGKAIADKAFNEMNEDSSNFSSQELLGWAKYLSRFGRHRNAEIAINKAVKLSAEEFCDASEGIFEERIFVARSLGKFRESLELIEEWERILLNNGSLSELRNANLASSRGKAFEHLAQYTVAIRYYSMAMEIFESRFGLHKIETIDSFLDVGDVANHLGNYDDALNIYIQCSNRFQRVFGESHPNVASTLMRIGDIWQTKGQYDKALEFFESALKINIDYYGESHPNVASIITRIGDVRNTKGQYDMALEFFESALKINIDYYGESHPNVASTLTRIGDVWNTKGQYDKALEYFEKDLKISIDYYGESHPNVASTLMRIGDIWQTKGQYDEALEYFEKDLKISIDYYGESHPNVASTLTRIGDVWNTKGQYDKALEYFESVLKINIDYYGESHPNVASTLTRIGDVWNTKGQYEKALEYFEKDLKISIDYYGESHPEVASTFMRIGDICYTKVHYDKALEYFENALKIYIDYSGTSHPNLGVVFFKIGQIWDSKGQFDQALEYFEKDLRISIEYYGESSTNVASTLLRIGGIWERKGQYDKGLGYFERALKIYMDYYGESHPDVGSTYTRIGDVWNTKGQYDKALEYFERGLKISIDYYGESDPNVANVLTRIGDIWNSKGQYDSAIKCFENVLKIYINYNDEYHPSVAAVMTRIGGVLYTQGHFVRALEYFENALKVYKDCQGESHHNVASTLTRIGDVLETQGQYDKALDYFEQTLKIRLDCYGTSHPSVAVSYYKLGGICNTKGQYDKALEYYEKDLKISIEFYGESHPDVASTLKRIGDIWKTKGQYEKAMDYFVKDLKISIDCYGESHPSVATSLNSIGLVQLRLRQYSQSLNSFDKVLPIYLESYGKNHRDSAGTKRNRARALMGLNRYDEAEQMLTEAVLALKESELEHDLVLAHAYQRYAELYRLTRRLEDAMKSIDESISIFLTNPGEQHVDTADAYFEKALIAAALHDEKSTPYFQKCCDIRLDLLGPKHPDTIEVLEKLNLKN